MFLTTRTNSNVHQKRFTDTHIVFIHIHYLKSFETGDMKYVMMFAAIGFGVALVIVLVVVACVRKSKSSTANGV